MAQDWDDVGPAPSVDCWVALYCVSKYSPGSLRYWAGPLVEWLKLPVWKVGDRGFVPALA